MASLGDTSAYALVRHAMGTDRTLTDPTSAGGASGNTWDIS